MQAPKPSPAELSPEELQTVALFQENTPSVVNIANIGAPTLRRAFRPVAMALQCRACCCIGQHVKKARKCPALASAAAVASYKPGRLQARTAADGGVRGAASRQSFYSMDVQQVPQGMGSGFIWDDKVLTCALHLSSVACLGSVGT